MKTKKWSRQDRLGNILFLVILGGGLLALILNLILPDKADSDTENRPLSQMSDIQARGLWTGETGREISDWYADQFPLRNSLLHLNYCVQRLEGVSEIDDVYIGSHMLLQQAPAYDAAVSDQNLQAIRDFQAKTGIPVNVQIVPTSIAVNADRLPMNATSADEAAAIADIQSKSQDLGFINSLDTLASHKDEDLYYATDHHWKSRGAWYAWTDLAAAKGWSADEAAFDILKAADGFQGTLSAKTGDPFLSDTVEIWVPKNGPEYVMTKDGVKARTIYDESALDRRDKYQVFTGPNTGEFTLEMDNDSPVRLLLFKDSYANAMLQFLIPQCRSITVVDPRYYDGNLDRLMETGVFTDVLFLYNYSSWVQDHSLKGVLDAKSGKPAANETENS